MMNEEVSPSAEPPIGQHKSLEPSGFVWGLGLCLWGGLAAAAFDGLARFRKIFLDFGTDLPAATGFLLQFGQSLIPAMAITACCIAILVNESRAKSIILLWVPLLLSSVLFVLIGIPLLKLLNDLS